MSLNATGRPRSGDDAMPRRFGRAARRIEIERDEGADVLLARGDRLGAKLDDGARREFAGVDAAGKIERRKHHACPAATMIVISLVMNVGLPGAMWPESRFGIKARSGSACRAWLTSRCRNTGAGSIEQSLRNSSHCPRMTRGVRWYLVSSLVLVALIALAGCSHYLLAEREPWRHEAELSCLNSGAVKETPERVRISAIGGPGACGIDYPIRVSALGDNPPLELRRRGGAAARRDPEFDGAERFDAAALAGRLADCNSIERLAAGAKRAAAVSGLSTLSGE